MKTIIVFRAGHSGHYLEALINNRPVDAVGQRMKEAYWKQQMNGIYLTHRCNYEEHQKRFDCALRILPQQKIYHAIYNIFVKKTLVEDVIGSVFWDWKSHPAWWYVKTYQYLDDFFNLINNDIQTNEYQNVVNFDQLLDPEYIAHVLRSYFDLPFCSNRQSLVNNYAKLQLPMDLLTNDTACIREIVEPLTDQMLEENPWFFSYCIFKFERNNNLLESNRIWSIDNLNTVQLKKDLFDIATQYR